MASGPGRVIPVRNPRTGEYDTEIPAADSGAIAAWADQLRAAQGAWLARGAAGRAAILTRFADELQAQFSDLAEQLSVDTGRRTFAQFEVVRAIELLRHWAERIETELDAINDCGRSQQVASVSFSHVAIPYEVVAVISPWNVPLLLAMIDSAPALAAGCSVLLKPSEVTPRFIAPLQAALSRVPELAAVFRVVTGDAETGRAMIDRADAVCFTGSVATGRQVARQAAERFIPAFLELGGKDPALVLADADLDIAARAVIRSAVGMTGQACQSLERIYCHADVYDAFLATLLAQLDELSLT
ncbi:MAG: aldehyde dehydrogenase family protein, partial [Luminiphilus sp.]